MRISDWSSDVCSSDLQARRGAGEEGRPALRAAQAAARARREEQAARLMSLPPVLQRLKLPVIGAPMFIAGNPKLVIEQCRRSEERRGGKESVSMCRFRW